MDTVTPEAVAATGIFDARAIEALIRDHMERRINAGYHLWGLLTLFLWMKRWKVEAPPRRKRRRSERAGLRYQLIVALVAALIFLGCMVSPPSLMDDVDAVQAQIARNMLQSGDWVTARLDGVAYLEKSPLKYWMMAVSFAIFGVHDWAARIPLALSDGAAVLGDGAVRGVGIRASAWDCTRGWCWRPASGCSCSRAS